MKWAKKVKPSLTSSTLMNFSLRGSHFAFIGCMSCMHLAFGRYIYTIFSIMTKSQLICNSMWTSEHRLAMNNKIAKRETMWTHTHTVGVCQTHARRTKWNNLRNERELRSIYYLNDGKQTRKKPHQFVCECKQSSVRAKKWLLKSRKKERIHSEAYYTHTHS